MWIHWVMTCISSACMTILLNGSPVHNFIPKRGLRQGNPLSPYLFIIAMEVLSRLIQQKVDSGLISGFKINRHTPLLHHCFFADDVFLMGKCTFNEAFQFKDCLDRFCHWSGYNLIRSLRVGRVECFPKLKGFGKSFCLKAWDAICKPKSCGGLGFHHMKDFNVAILSNWGWKILIGASSLCLSVLRAKYLYHTGLFDTPVKAGDSRFWKLILPSVNLLKEGACYMVGDGCEF
ncbi:hypothetical protein UlMin_045385 [Ulmus minor]